MNARSEAAFDLIQDLYHHQHWADGQVWTAVHSFPGAHGDPELRERLAHIHGAQQLWLARWETALGTTREGEPLRAHLATAEDFTTWDDLRHFARQGHAGMDAFLGGLRPRDLQREVLYKSIHGEPFTGLLGDLMLHLPLHSEHHRGQVALVLRRLAITPPATDLVVWHRLGRPRPDWI